MLTSATAVQYRRLIHGDSPGWMDMTAERKRCLAVCGDLLVRSNLWSKLSMLLLHRHFLMKSDEVMVEWTPPGEQLVINEPITPALRRGRALRPTSLFFQPAGSGFELVTFETGLAGAVPEIDWQSPELRCGLAEIYTVLRDHGMVDHLGIGVRRDRLAQRPGQCLFELCFQKERRLVNILIDRDEAAEPNKSQTYWSFVPAGIRPEEALGLYDSEMSSGVVMATCEKVCNKLSYPPFTHESKHNTKYTRMNADTAHFRFPSLN